MTHIRKIKAGGVNTSWDNFVGEVGTLFYDQALGNLRLSDGHTPGGIPISVDTTIAAATTSTLGGVKVDGSTIVINNGVISAIGGTGTTVINTYTTIINTSTTIINTSTTIINTGTGTTYTAGDNISIVGSTISVSDFVHLGTTATDNYSGTYLQIDYDLNSYGEVVLKNKNSGSTASTDIVIMNDLGGEFNNYIDIGINSSNYSQPTYSVTHPNDGYVFVNGGDLVLGTQSPSTKIVFHAGGTTEGNSAMYLNTYGLTVNRRVEVIVDTPSELRFKVQNQSSNVEAKALFEAVNNAGTAVHFGILNNNPASTYGVFQPGDAFFHVEDNTATLHIGSYGDIAIYANQANGYDVAPAIHVSQFDQTTTFRGDVVPAQDLTYDLGSTSSQWRSLYVGTSTIYIGGKALSITPAGNITVDGSVIGGSGSTSTFTVSEISGSTITNEVTTVSAIRFDKDTGFSVTDLGSGEVKVSLGSSWKTWNVSGQDSLIAVGEDTVEFVAGTNMNIVTSATDKTITFNSTMTGWTVDAFNHLVPNTDNLQDIGTPSLRVRHIYVGPGSITVGNSVITESNTGKLVLPGLTRGTGFSINEIEDTADQTYSFGSTPTIIDNAYFAILNGITAPGGYSAPQYSVDQLDGEGFIDGISIDSQGSGLTQDQVNLMRSNMWAYVGSDQDPINNWNSNDWISIPFRVRCEASDVEYDFQTGGGGATALDELSDTDISNPQVNQSLVWDGENWTNLFVYNGGSSTHIEYTDTATDYTSTVDLTYDFTVDTEKSHANFNGNGFWDIGSHNFHTKIFSTDEIAPDPQDIVIMAGSQNNNWMFGRDGVLSLPSGGDIQRDGVSVLGGASAITISETAPTATTGTQWFNTVDGRLYIAYNSQWVDASPQVIAPSSTYLGDITASSSTFYINTSTLTIDDTGTLLVNGAQVTGAGGAASSLTNGLYTVALDSSGVFNLSTASIIQGAGTDPNVYVETVGNTTSTWTFGTDGIFTLPADTPVIKGGGTGSDVTIVASDNITTATWIFKTTGTIVFPDGTLQTTAYTGSGSGSATTSSLVNGSATITLNSYGNLIVDTLGGSILAASGSYTGIGSHLQETYVYVNTDGFYVNTNYNTTATTWHFDNSGVLTFPDSTQQTTAWKGWRDATTSSVTIGDHAGLTSPGDRSVAVGGYAGYEHQGTNAIAIGNVAATYTQGDGAIAIGSEAGNLFQGANAIAIGNKAAHAYQTAGSILLNASGNYQEVSHPGFFVNPIRNTSATSHIIHFDTLSQELTYATFDESFMSAMATYDGAIVTNTATIGVGGLTVNGPVTFNSTFEFLGTATVISSNSGTFYGDIYGVGALYAGVAGYSPLPSTVIQSSANVNAYIQNNFQNINNGVQASTEWVATANNGDDSNHYLDMGIAGSAWDGSQSNSVGTAAQANDSWIYAQGSTSTSAGGNLILGTIKNGKAVKILAGSTGSSSIVATFNGQGLTVNTGTVTFADGTIQSTAATTFNTSTLVRIAASATSAVSLLNGSTTIRMVSAPSSLAGVSGDKLGDIAFDGGYIYYCTRNFYNGAYTYNYTVNASIASQNAYLPAPNQATIGTLVYIQGPLPIAPTTGWTLTYAGNTYPIAPNGNPNNGVTSQVYLTASGINIPAGSGITITAPIGSDIWTRTRWNAGDKFGFSVSTGAASGGGSLTYQSGTGAFTFQPAVTQNPTFSQGITINSNVTSSWWGTTGIAFKTSAASYLDSSSVTLANHTAIHAIATPTLTSFNPTTYSTASTLYIAGAPIAGTSATITNKLALNVASGNVFFANTVTVGGHVVQPALPSFRMAGIGSQVVSYTNTNILTGTNFVVDYNQGNYLNTSTGFFTAPVAGIYQVNLVVRAKDNASPLSSVCVRKTTNTSSTNNASSGTNVVFLEYAANTTVNHMGGASTVKMAAGESLALFMAAGSIMFDNNDCWSVAFLG